MINRLKEMFLVNDTIHEIKDLSREISLDVKSLKECHSKYQANIALYKRKWEESEKARELDSQVFLAVIDKIEDMVWAKDLDGKYIMANKAFRDNFCYGISWAELKGMTDVEIDDKFKKLVGDDNHTLGSSPLVHDKIIHDRQEERRFLEEGKVDGKLVKLVISKSPVYDFEGVMFAVCGTGRDITKWHDDVEKVITTNTNFGDEAKEALLAEFNKVELGSDEYGYK